MKLYSFKVQTSQFHSLVYEVIYKLCFSLMFFPYFNRITSFGEVKIQICNVTVIM